MSNPQKTDDGSVWVASNAIFDGEHLLADAALRITDGKVTDVVKQEDLPDGAPIRVLEGLVTPGFFDIQVNGGGGILLNSEPTLEGIAMIIAAHRSLGTTSLFPTIISDHPAVLEDAANAAISATHLAGMAGLHIEGPHISTAKRGTHDASVLRALDQVTLNVVSRLSDADISVLITIAPEAATPKQVTQLVERGAVVSIGHSNARCEDAIALVEAGATGFTHLFNAMSQIEGRAPGVVGAGLTRNAWCSIIADGHHVARENVLLAFKAKSDPERMIVISDAMPTVGGPDTFQLYDQKIHLKSGKLINDEGALAGAHLNMLDAIRNLVEWGIPLDTALRAGRRNPAQFMGMASAIGVIGCNADDLLHLSNDLELRSVGLR